MHNSNNGNISNNYDKISITKIIKILVEITAIVIIIMMMMMSPWY